VCDVWDHPDDTRLNVEEWIVGNPSVDNKSVFVKDLIDNSFKQVETYMRNFHKFLEKVYENENIDFNLLLNEKIKDPALFIPLLFKRFKGQIDDFDNYLPESKDLGMLRVDFFSIKQKLKPSPKECFDKMRKMLPPEIKRRIEQCKVWIVKQSGELTKKVGDNPDEFVEQLKQLEYTKEQIQDFSDKLDLCFQLQRTCIEYSIEITKEE
jgi:hypothetical protein